MLDVEKMTHEEYIEYIKAKYPYFPCTTCENATPTAGVCHKCHRGSMYKEITNESNS